MMRRQIFMWMGLVALLFAIGSGHEVFAADGYKVKQGDNLARISKKFGVSVAALKAANNLQNDALKPRQMLLIPKPAIIKASKSKKSTPVATATYVVKKGENLHAISRTTGISVSDLMEMNHIRSSRLQIGQRLIIAKSKTREDVAEASADNVQQADVSALPEDDELEEEDAGAVSADDRESADNVADHAKEESTEFLGKWRSSDERQLFARVALGFLGAPYRFGGSSVRGLDCSAYVKKIYAFFNISLPRTAREQARVGKHIPRSELEVGDLVFFNTRRRPFGHVGIYIGNNEFVHASSGRARVVKVDTLERPYYNKRFVRAVRLKALDDDA